MTEGTQTQFEPMGIGAILDRSFSLYRQNLIRFLAIVAVIQVPLLLLSFALQYLLFKNLTQPEPGQFSANQFLPALVAGLVILAANTLSNGAMARAVSDAYLGRDVGVGATYGKVLPRLLSLLGVTLVIVLIGGGALVVVALLFAVSPALGGLTMLVLGIFAIVYALKISLSAQAIVVENVGTFPGITRSMTLTLGNLGKVFLLFLAVFLITLIVNWVFGFLGRLIAPPPEMITSAEKLDAFIRSIRVQQLIQSVGQLLIAPFAAGASVLMYYDLRIRKEGFDLEMLAQSMGQPATEP